jgi:hypothetical protein
MTEEDIRRELTKIAVTEIGKRNVASSSVRPVVDFDDKAALEVAIVLRHDAPEVSGKTYISILVKAYDFLGALGDSRRPGLALDRMPSATVASAK